MKKITLFALLGTTLISIPANSAELIVNIDKIISTEGKIYIQVFKGENNYNNDKPETQTMINAEVGPAQITFNDLSSGEYAVRLYHDQNNNQKFDQNLFGMPTEGYAFSNEAAPNFGPPSFQDMVVTIGDDNAVIKTKAKMFY